MKFNGKIFLPISVVCVLIVLLACTKDVGIKPDVLGCDHAEALNYEPTATKNNGTCIFPSIIENPDFESDNGWAFSGGPDNSYSMGYVNIPTGFMPTSGKYYLMCIPYFKKQTSASQYLKIPNKHYKGILFDYEIFAESRWDSILDIAAGIGLGRPGSPIYVNGIQITYKENAKTFQGKPNLHIKKLNQYSDIVLCDDPTLCRISIWSLVNAGTFTFCIDNIRLIKNY